MLASSFSFCPFLNFQLQDEAAMALVCLEKCSNGGFEEVFMTKIDFAVKYDHCIRYRPQLFYISFFSPALLYIMDGFCYWFSLLLFNYGHLHQSKISFCSTSCSVFIFIDWIWGDKISYMHQAFVLMMSAGDYMSRKYMGF